MLRVWLAWLCYWIGDAFSRPLHWGGDTWVNILASEEIRDAIRQLSQEEPQR